MFPNTSFCNTYGQSERAANITLFLTRAQFEEESSLICSVGMSTQFTRIKLVDEQGNESSSGEADGIREDSIVHMNMESLKYRELTDYVVLSNYVSEKKHGWQKNLSEF
jgi:hypothetical protein